MSGRRVLAIGVVGACLACGGAAPAPEPVGAPEPPPAGEPTCLTVRGRDVDADLRLVFDGRTVVGGTLTWTDRSAGTSGIAEPLTGRRRGDKMTARGPVYDSAGGRSGEVEVLVARRTDGPGLGMAIDGEEVIGQVRVGPCDP